MQARPSSIATSLSLFGRSLAIASLVACAADGDGDDGAAQMCTPPAALTYACSPVPLGSADSCAGGPALYNDPRPDTDKAFPVGCEAQLPFCVSAYPAYVQTCSCEPGTGSGPEWVCPI